VIIYFISDKGRTVAIELDIIALVSSDRVKVTVENRHINLLAACKDIALEK
jgi:hypothetical protein